MSRQCSVECIFTLISHSGKFTVVAEADSREVEVLARDEREKQQESSCPSSVSGLSLRPPDFLPILALFLFPSVHLAPEVPGCRSSPSRSSRLSASARSSSSVISGVVSLCRLGRAQLRRRLSPVDDSTSATLSWLVEGVPSLLRRTFCEIQKALVKERLI